MVEDKNFETMKNYNIRVKILNIGKDGVTKCFIVKDVNTGKEYTIYNCHRTESLFWKSHYIHCYIGNVELDSDSKTVKKAFLRINSRNRIGVLFF